MFIHHPTNLTACCGGSSQSIPKRVDSATVGEVSVPLAFICLLHLCNEKDLEVKIQMKFVSLS